MKFIAKDTPSGPSLRRKGWADIFTGVSRRRVTGGLLLLSLLFLCGVLWHLFARTVDAKNSPAAVTAPAHISENTPAPDDSVDPDGSVYSIEDTMELMEALLATPGDGFGGADDGPATAAAGVFKSASGKKATAKTMDEKAQAYINRFKGVAISEWKARGILPSVKLAQGLIESRSGESFLATKANNHFGMKCGNQKKGHKHEKGRRCVKRCDDSCSDHFWVMPSAWASYRAHSDLLLRAPRYKKAIAASKSGNYVQFAQELKRAGYATNKKYAPIISSIIKRYKLYEVDRQAGAPVCWSCR